ncbi:MAG: transposase [Acidobacteriota bacterium]|nr:transposase [Acidobacteriota bacterium]
MNVPCGGHVLTGPRGTPRLRPKRQTSQEFIALVSDLVSRSRWAQQIHIVLDNLSAHKTKAVQPFLADHPKVRFHFTPTYSSRLNQVELWFAKI